MRAMRLPQSTYAWAACAWPFAISALRQRGLDGGHVFRLALSSDPQALPCCRRSAKDAVWSGLR
jgi:hypothetical protein